MQKHDAFQGWQRERDAVEAEMNVLLKAGMPASAQERQIRQIQFQALIERREAAARSLLQFDRSLRGRKSPAMQAQTSDRLGPGSAASQDSAPIAPAAMPEAAAPAVSAQSAN
jgi:hypothetical protein